MSRVECQSLVKASQGVLESSEFDESTTLVAPSQCVSRFNGQGLVKTSECFFMQSERTERASFVTPESGSLFAYFRHYKGMPSQLLKNRFYCTTNFPKTGESS